MRFGILMAIAGLLGSSPIFAQSGPTPSPSPLPSGRSAYLLEFNGPLSLLMLGSGGTGLSLGPATQSTDANGCTLTGSVDGPIVCLTATTCPATYPNVPVCAAAFIAPSGLTTTDVANLVTAQVGSAAAAMARVVPEPSVSSALTPQSLYEALRGEALQSR